MRFCGEIVFLISSDEKLQVEFDKDFQPSKVIAKGDIVALGRVAPTNRWLYIIRFDGQEDYLQKLDKLTDELVERRQFVSKMVNMCDEVSINIYMRSDFAEIGHTLPIEIVKKIATLECTVNYFTFSYGKVECEEEQDI